MKEPYPSSEQKKKKMTTIIIDSRETRLISLWKDDNHPLVKKSSSTDSIDHPPEIQTQLLDIGDISIVYEESQHHILIERKTIQDLWQSIVDHRLQEQRARLSEWSSACPTHRHVIYLIEYDHSYEKDKEKQNTIEGVLHRLTFLYQFMVHKVHHLSETKQYIQWLSTQTSLWKTTDIQKDKMESWTHSVLPKKKEVQTPNHLLHVLLMSIQGISYRIAKEITLDSLSVQQYITKLQTTPMSVLSDIKISTQKLGLSRAKRIYQLLGIENLPQT